MFVGITKNNKNERALDYFENLVMDYDKFRGRILLTGPNNSGKTKLIQTALTILNTKDYITKYYIEKDIINKEIDYSSLKKYDIIAIDNLFQKDIYTDTEKERLHDFFTIMQHSDIWLVTNLNSKEMFSDKIRNFLDNGITWSRNILGCKQLFMDVTQQNEFYKMLLKEPRGDYRLVQTKEFLESVIEPYNKLYGLFNKDELISIIESGDDNYNNTLIIDKSGKIRLVKFENLQMYKGNIAVRLETFCAGNGYIGKNISEKELNRLYMMLLEGYYQFLLNGEEAFIDMPLTNDTEIELIRKIKKIRDSQNTINN